MDLKELELDRKELTAKILGLAGENNIDLSYIATDLIPNIVKTETVHLDPSNTNKHTENDLEKTESSLINYGFRAVINCSRVNGELVVSAGNGRLMIAKKLGWPYVPVSINSDGPLKHTQFGIIDNITGIPDFDWALMKKTLDALEAEGQLNTIVIDGDFLMQVKEQLGDFEDNEGDFPEQKEFDEEIANDVEMVNCPHCGGEFPK